MIIFNQNFTKIGISIYSDCLTFFIKQSEFDKIKSVCDIYGFEFGAVAGFGDNYPRHALCHEKSIFSKDQQHMHLLIEGDKLSEAKIEALSEALLKHDLLSLDEAEIFIKNYRQLKDTQLDNFDKAYLNGKKELYNLRLFTNLASIESSLLGGSDTSVDCFAQPSLGV